MSESKKYNGWTNYETWNYALWLDNDQGSQEYWGEQAQAQFDASAASETFSRKEESAFALADIMRAEAEEFVSMQECKALESSWLADAVNAYISEVNFREIAEHFLSDVEEEEETTEQE